MRREWTIDMVDLKFYKGIKRIRRMDRFHFWEAILLLSVVFVVGGCAQFREDLRDGFTQFSEGFRRGLLEDREGAIKKFGYTGKNTEIIVESLLISPYTVKPGDKLRQELKYALLAPEAGRNFSVVEKAIFTDSRGEKIDLLLNESEKGQGVHLLTFNITVPLDIEPGEYNIISTISTVNLSKTAKGYFIIRK